MSSPEPSGNPFEGLLGELARLIGSSNAGPLNWDVARQVATMLAGAGQSEPNVDPVDRIAIEELARVAELHVDQALDIPVSVRQVETLTHIEWANRTLDDYNPILTSLAKSLNRQDESSSANAVDPANPLASMQSFLGPMLFGMQGGGMVGNMARRCLGRFDLPLPRTDTDSLVVVPSNIDAFSEEWSLPRDELRLYACIEEIIRMAIMSRPHVKASIGSLVDEYVSGFEPDSNALEEQLSQLDIQDPSQMSRAFSDPQILLGAIQTPAQQHTSARLQALMSAFVGFVDHTVATIAAKTVSSAPVIAEAVKRRRVEENDGARFVERLFGMELSQTQFDRGEAFVRGVQERDAGGLARLWHSARELPTPAEVDAPGLWLERIDIPDINTDDPPA